MILGKNTTILGGGNSAILGKNFFAKLGKSTFQFSLAGDLENEVNVTKI